MKTPEITVITPSYNQAEYIEETILSVIGQMSSGMEYIIMDGGSQDGSVDIIKQYHSKIDFWLSEPDRGQAHAINKGFDKASGNILSWLNSDDMYLPGTLKYVSQFFNQDEPEVLFGNCILFDPKKTVMWGGDVIKDAESYDLNLMDYVIQPSAFWNRKAWEVTGSLNESLHYTFDWEWFIRAKLAGVKFTPVNKYLSIYRVHDQHKTGTGGIKRREEIINILERYNSPSTKNLLQALAYKGKNIKQIEYFLKKLKLSKWEKYVLYMVYPSLYFRYPYQKIKAISRMI